jgi:hypothetical protein
VVQNATRQKKGTTLLFCYLGRILKKGVGVECFLGTVVAIYKKDQVGLKVSIFFFAVKIVQIRA